MREAPRVPHLLAVVALTTVLATAGACARHRDRFWPDTDGGRLALSSPRVITGDPDRIIEMQMTGDPGHPSAIRRVSHVLEVGDRVVVGISVAKEGEYRSGGGWIFKGRRYVGRYGVSGDILEASSDRPDVLAVVLEESGNLELTAVAPGECTVTLSATERRPGSTRPPANGVVTDTTRFRVGS